MIMLYSSGRYEIGRFGVDSTNLAPSAIPALLWNIRLASHDCSTHQLTMAPSHIST